MSKIFAAILFGALVFAVASCSEIKTFTGDTKI